jgi:hypothetical protein
LRQLNHGGLIVEMPMDKAEKQAKTAEREGKSPSTQAGAFVKEEMHKLKRGEGTARSRRQAVAIGLSEARRAGVRLGAAKRGDAATRKKSKRDVEIGQGKGKSSLARSRAGKKAAATRRRNTKAAER